MTILQRKIFAIRLTAVCLALSIPTIALAQEMKRPDPVDSAAAVPAMQSESAFSDYRPFEAQKLAPWQQTMAAAANTKGMDMAGMDMSGTADPAGHGSVPAPSTTASNSSAKETIAAATPKPDREPAAPSAGNVENAATGVILQIDKANGKVKISHQPIKSLGWPKMTMFFRLKDASLADQVKENEKVDFFLEKTPNGYVVSRFGKPSETGKAGESR